MFLFYFKNIYELRCCYFFYSIICVILKIWLYIIVPDHVYVYYYNIGIYYFFNFSPYLVCVIRFLANHIQDMQMMNILPPSQLIDLLSQHYHAVCIFLVYLVIGEIIGIVILENNLQILTHKGRKTLDIFTLDGKVL